MIDNFFYTLGGEDGHEPVLTDAESWGLWIESNPNRHVGNDEIGDFLVSTVFLTTNHNWGFTDPRPVLFETMIFRKNAAGEYKSDNYQERFCTWKEAEVGHWAGIAVAEGWIATGYPYLPKD